ncbi:MAG: biotin--[acetyl-CoA-carboxylase] ligase [Gemmobacter sp.]
MADWPAGVGLVVLDRVDSTNAEAVRRMAQAPVWVLAGEQTGGRGRRGRAWASPRGNFHATLVMRPGGGAGDAALRSFVAALALREALAAVTGAGAALALKWPNDVLLSGGKVAGILLEAAGDGVRVAHLAVGIGVNLIAAPDAAFLEEGALRPVTVLGETGVRVEPRALLDHLAPAFARWEAVLVAEGFAPVRAEWLAHAARLGEPIRARTGAETREGVFETLDATGALVLRMGGGRVAIPAADVFF